MIVLVLLGVLLAILLLLTPTAHAQCGGSCNACARRFGCMTAAWGKCCTQFFMHNGKKRSSSPPLPIRSEEQERRDTVEAGEMEMLLKMAAILNAANSQNNYMQVSELNPQDINCQR